MKKAKNSNNRGPLPLSVCIAEKRAVTMPVTTKTKDKRVMRSLRPAVLRFHCPFSVPIARPRLISVWPLIHTMPPMKVRKAPSQWIFWTMSSSLERGSLLCSVRSVWSWKLPTRQRPKEQLQPTYMLNSLTQLSFLKKGCVNWQKRAFKQYWVFSLYLRPS